MDSMFVERAALAADGEENLLKMCRKKPHKITAKAARKIKGVGKKK